MKDKPQSKIPSVGRLIFKSLLLACLILFACITIQITYYQVRDDVKDRTDTTEALRHLDWQYYQEHYAELYDIMNLYEYYDPEIYGQYWEAVDASQDYYDFLLWSRAAERGYEGATEKAEAFREKVLQNPENCRYSFNQTILDGFAEKVR